MDTARYVVAVLVWVALPPAIVYWLVVHPFVGFWRRLGKGPTFVALAIMFVATGFGLVLVRDWVLVREFGTHWGLWVAALVSYVTSVAIEIQCRKHLKFKTLAGVPEIERDQASRKLLDQGIYGRVRHPRYVSVTFGMLAMAFFANYLTIWLLIPATVVSLFLIATLEERELVASMGERYREYQARVPMFVPRFDSGRGGS